MPRIKQLDGLRAIAFLAVFLNHSILVPMLWTGVDLFFVLSGFLITGILLRARETGPRHYFQNFYTRRFVRIIPPYVIVIAAVAIGFTIDWGRLWYYYAFFIQNIALVTEGGQGALQPLWSLGVEEQFYLAWPLLVLYLSPTALKRLCIVILCVAPVLRAIFTPLASSYITIFVLTPFRMDELAAGAFIALLKTSPADELARYRQPAKYLAIASGICFVGLAALVPDFRAKTNSMLFNVAGYSLATLGCAGLLAYCLSLKEGLFYSILSHPWMRYIGAISYMCYLIHAPILDWLGAVSNLPRSVLALAATLAFAAISWHLVEKPLLERGRRVPAATAVPSVAAQ